MEHLIASSFVVTALTTDPVKAAETYSGIRTIPANYADTADLVPSLRGFDALVIIVSRAEDTIQIALIDAAIDAGIPYVIPSSFGIDTRIPAVREVPTLAAKVAVEDHLFARAAEGRIAFTIIQTGISFEWGIPVNLSGTAPSVIFDGGNVPFSISSLDDIGRGVANAVALRNYPGVRNKVLLMHSTVTTQNQLVRYVRELRPDIEWKTVDADTESAYAAAQEAYDCGERDPAVLQAFLSRMTFGLGLGLFEQHDSQLLGIETWWGDRLKSAVEEGILAMQGGDHGRALACHTYTREFSFFLSYSCTWW